MDSICYEASLVRVLAMFMLSYASFSLKFFSLLCKENLPMQKQ